MSLAPTPKPPGPSAVTPLVSIPNAAYQKNGHWVIDTNRKDAGGHVPTHRLDQASGKTDDETWSQYEDRVIGRNSFSADTAARNDLGSLERPVADSARSLLAAAKSAGVPLRVGETRRTQERQEMLFRQGRAKGTGPVVTWTLTSDHTPGRALDFVGSSAAMRWLQLNAPKYGFSVMGDMDPGHVSMP